MDEFFSLRSCGGLFLLVSCLNSFACHSHDSVQANVNAAGTYRVGAGDRLTIGADGAYTIELGPALSGPLSATGTMSGNVLSLTAQYSGITIQWDLTFDSLRQSATGKQKMLSGGTILAQYQVLAQKGNYLDVDLSSGTPAIVTASPVDLNQMGNLSMYRSGVGHSYNDATESCRSMKIYFQPTNAIAGSFVANDTTNHTVSVFAPFDGTVVALGEDTNPAADDGVHNQHLSILSSDNSTVSIQFHTTLVSANIKVGSTVTSGQLLGYGTFFNRNGGNAIDGSNFDMALHMSTSSGFRLSPLVSAMDNTLFSTFSVWAGGGATRANFQISKTLRDTNPISCTSGLFTANFVSNQNSVYNWVK